ncbi:hypothetical protein H4S02_003607 [Coemansia sp. RSA 2611]|nr:hypothetical protein H4S01_000618 [Coemansia sp. RSA 2610]KAJ2386952.1 hypothetical protein H4S02_003607 [Coemansia sp. RSA 2611]
MAAAMIRKVNTAGAARRVWIACLRRSSSSSTMGTSGSATGQPGDNESKYRDDERDKQPAVVGFDTGFRDGYRAGFEEGRRRIEAVLDTTKGRSAK